MDMDVYVETEQTSMVRCARVQLVVESHAVCLLEAHAASAAWRPYHTGHMRIGQNALANCTYLNKKKATPTCPCLFLYCTIYIYMYLHRYSHSHCKHLRLTSIDVSLFLSQDACRGPLCVAPGPARRAGGRLPAREGGLIQVPLLSWKIQTILSGWHL